MFLLTWGNKTVREDISAVCANGIWNKARVVIVDPARLALEQFWARIPAEVSMFVDLIHLTPNGTQTGRNR